MNKVRILFVAVLLILFIGLGGRAFAEWGDVFCDINQEKPEEASETLKLALTVYRETEGKSCRVIRFMKAQTISVPGGLTFLQPALFGPAGGLVLRKCYSEEGAYKEDSDCPVLKDTDVTLDFSGYERDKGDCPIRIGKEARVLIKNVRLFVKNPAKAICKDDTGEPIVPSDDPEITKEMPSSYGRAYRVTVGGLSILPPTCRISQERVTFPEEGFVLKWKTTFASSVNLSPYFWGLGGESLTPNTEGSKTINPSEITTYYLTATGLDGTPCSDIVTLYPTPSCEHFRVEKSKTGEGYSLVWKTKNLAGKVVVTDKSSGKELYSGLDAASSVKVDPKGETGYTLTADGMGGRHTCTINFTPPVVTVKEKEVVKDTGLKDADGDGVVDSKDKCLGTPKETKVDGEGCPLKPPADPSALTCGLKAPDKPDVEGNYELVWSSQNATKVTVTEEAAPTPDKKDSKPEKKVINDGKLSGNLKVKPATPTVYTIVAEKEGGNCTVSLTRPPPATPNPAENPGNKKDNPVLEADDGCGCRIDGGRSSGGPREALPFVWIGLTLVGFRVCQKISSIKNARPSSKGDWRWVPQAKTR